MSQYPYGPYGGYGPGDAVPGPVERPASLTLAVRLMYAGAVLSLLSVLSTFVVVGDLREEAERQVERDNLDVDPDTIVNVALAFGVGVGLLAVALWVWMAVMNGRGRSWARIVATVLGALSLCSGAASFAQPATSPVAFAFSLANIVLAVVILVLIWQRPSTEYYRARSARR